MDDDDLDSEDGCIEEEIDDNVGELFLSNARGRE